MHWVNSLIMICVWTGHWNVCIYYLETHRKDCSYILISKVSDYSDAVACLQTAQIFLNQGEYTMKYNNTSSGANSFLCGVGIIITYFLFLRRNMNKYLWSFINSSNFTPFALSITVTIMNPQKLTGRFFYLPTHKLCLVL